MFIVREVRRRDSRKRRCTCCPQRTRDTSDYTAVVEQSQPETPAPCRACCTPCRTYRCRNHRGFNTSSAAKTTQKNPRSPTSKAKEAESVNILTVNIPNHVQALHDIMTRRDAGAPLDELREMVIRYQKDHNNTEHVLRALDILVQATLEKGETSASILVLSEWIGCICEFSQTDVSETRPISLAPRHTV